MNKLCCIILSFCLSLSIIAKEITDELVKIANQSQVVLKEDSVWNGVRRCRVLVRAGTTIVNNGPKTIFQIKHKKWSEVIDSMHVDDEFKKFNNVINSLEDKEPKFVMLHDDVIVFKIDIILEVEAFKSGLMELLAKKGGKSIITLGID